VPALLPYMIERAEAATQEFIRNSSPRANKGRSVEESRCTGILGVAGRLMNE